MKTKLLSTILLILFGFSVHGQNPYEVAGRNFDDTPTFIKFQETANFTVENFFNSMKEEFKFTSDDSMELYKTTSDKLGFKHYRYNQKYKKVLVYGAEYLLHEKDGKVKTANGKIFLGLNIDVAPTVKEQDALKNAMQYLGEKKYRWQDKKSEQALKNKTKNPNATYYPKGKLVIAPLNGEYKKGNFILCWMFNIAGDRLDKAWTVFIDAHNGQIINKISEIADADVTGSATTRYNGTQPITCFYNTGNGLYDLAEGATRGPTHSQQIITLNMNGDTNIVNGVNWSAAQYITNATPTWTTLPVECQVHWNLENAYDFYYTVLGRNSVNDAGYPLGGLVHFGTNSLTGTPDNAFWTNQDTVMIYGEGDGILFGPMVGLDVSGHEITHGVTFFTAKLTYQGETGALNESFSDIMGTGVEIFTLGSNANWTIGENVVIPSSYTSCNYLRSMSNPKAGLVITNSSSQIIMDGRQPNTYHGQYWINTSSSTDHGGVHENSGVQNFWFYLLTNGGSGTNDNGDNYFVNGIGIDTALAIAYRTLTVYLTPTSVFSDAVLASEQSAQDFSHANSYEVQNVKNAWCAVGVIPCSTTDVSELTPDNTTSVFPNPFSFETTFKANSNFKNATLTVYNSFGQTVKQVDNLTGQIIVFHRDNLPSGLYFIRLMQDYKTFATEKLVITDN